MTIEGKERPQFEPQDRISWDEFFMEIALVAAKRTACIFHKIGSVFVDQNHRIISIGYNGPSVGDRHCNEVGCAKVHGDPITGDYNRCRGAHSEINAIINSNATMRFSGSTLYITTFPCYDCMKILNNVGIKRIVYYEDYRRIIDGSDGSKKEAEMEAWELAGRKNIKLEKYQDFREKELRLPNDEDLTSKKKPEVLEKKDKARW